MKNKKIILTGILGLVLCIGLATTLAYFTDSQSQKNTFVMGNVDIELTEPKFSQNTNSTVFNVVPNAIIDKDPTVTVGEDSGATYVRLVMSYEGITADQAKELQALIVPNAGWKIVDNYIYYNKALNAKDVVTAFDEVTVPNWKNEMANKTFSIDIKAEAVQADFFTPTLDTDGYIIGWPGVVVE